jgi:hypothetical protein
VNILRFYLGVLELKWWIVCCRIVAFRVGCRTAEQMVEWMNNPAVAKVGVAILILVVV